MKKLKIGLLVRLFYLFSVFGYAEDSCNEQFKDNLNIQGDFAYNMSQFAMILHPEGNAANNKFGNLNVRDYKAFSTTEGEVHNGFIALTNDNKVIIGFSGTDGAADWANTFAEFNKNLVSGIPGTVFGSFFDFANTIINQNNYKEKLFYYISQIGEGKEIPIYIVGHSKGGAAANIAAFLIKHMIDDYRSEISYTINIYTFGAPMAGDNDFSKAYNETFPETYSYRLEGDLVPLLPPSTKANSLTNAIGKGIDDITHIKLTNIYNEVMKTPFPVGYSLIYNKDEKRWACKGKTLESNELNNPILLDNNIHNSYNDNNYYKLK